MTPAWRRILIVGGFVLGVGIVGLLAFNTYAILTEEDGKTEPQLAEATETATPTPVVDVELSRECLGRQLETVNFERLLAAGLPELAGERLKRSSEAEAFVRRNCLKASVVPVMNPSTDIASSYVGAKTNVAMLTAEITQDEKEGFATDRRAGLRAQLEAFIQSHCD